jgi:hypothetical protein
MWERPSVIISTPDNSIRYLLPAAWCIHHECAHRGML